MKRAACVFLGGIAMAGLVGVLWPQFVPWSGIVIGCATGFLCIKVAGA